MYYCVPKRSYVYYCISERPYVPFYPVLNDHGTRTESNSSAFDREAYICNRGHRL